MTRFTPLGWITGAEGVALCLVPAWQVAPLAAAGGVAMLAALAAARVLAPRGLTGITAHWLPPRAIHAGAEVMMTAQVEGAAGVPPFAVWAYEPRAREQRRVARLTGGGSQCVRWAMRFPNRGAVQLPPLQVSGSQPLGLVEARRLAGEGTTVIVLPPIGRVRAGLRARLAEWFAGVAVAQETGSDDLGRLRAYMPGDPRSRIHWRASARHQQLLVAERHAPASRRLAIALDPSASAAVFERLVAAAATLVDDLSARGWELMVHHGQVPRGASGARDRLLEALALARPGGAPLEEIVPRGCPCLALLGEDTRAPDNQPPPLVIRNDELARLIHLPRRMGRT